MTPSQWQQFPVHHPSEVLRKILGTNRSAKGLYSLDDTGDAWMRSHVMMVNTNATPTYRCFCAMLPMSTRGQSSMPCLYEKGLTKCCKSSSACSLTFNTRASGSFSRPASSLMAFKWVQTLYSDQQGYSEKRAHEITLV